MPTTLPLARPLPQTEIKSRHLAFTLLMIWAVSLLLFSAITSLGPNPIGASSFEWNSPM